DISRTFQPQCHTPAFIPRSDSAQFMLYWRRRRIGILVAIEVELRCPKSGVSHIVVAEFCIVDNETAERKTSEDGCCRGRFIFESGRLDDESHKGHFRNH